MPSVIVHELVNNIYVDDFTGGCDTLEIAKNIYNESKDIFAKGGLNLTKWMSNNTEMQNYMNVTSKEETNVLGVTLNLINDFFSFEQYDFSTLSLKLTKRTFLALLAKPFDPLGFLSPFIMYAKIIMQLNWRLGLD